MMHEGAEERAGGFEPPPPAWWAGALAVSFARTHPGVLQTLGHLA